MNVPTVSLHPDFPEKVWVVVEQPRSEPHRLRYDRVSGSFERTPHKSLMFERGFSGAYGWVGGLGTPPEPHLDILLLTHQNPQPGNVLLGVICGVFYRGDGDHKLVALDAERRAEMTGADIDALDKPTQDELLRLYPDVREHEGWHGAEEARAYLRSSLQSYTEAYTEARLNLGPKSILIRSSLPLQHAPRQR